MLSQSKTHFHFFSTSSSCVVHKHVIQKNTSFGWTNGSEWVPEIICQSCWTVNQMWMNVQETLNWVSDSSRLFVWIHSTTHVKPSICLCVQKNTKLTCVANIQLSLLLTFFWLMCKFWLLYQFFVRFHNYLLTDLSISHIQQLPTQLSSTEVNLIKRRQIVKERVLEGFSAMQPKVSKST